MNFKKAFEKVIEDDLIFPTFDNDYDVYEEVDEMTLEELEIYLQDIL